MSFPEWTKYDVGDRDAIQFLRLNQLRDHINEKIFPYLTTITPYLRLTSWLSYIYYKLEKEMSHYYQINNKYMLSTEYDNKIKKYYRIFATANELYNQHNNIASIGPIGVRIVQNILSNTKGENIDINNQAYRGIRNPFNIYKICLTSMYLVEEKSLYLSSRRSYPILMPTKNGRKISELFLSKWIDIVDETELEDIIFWKKEKLINLGEKIHLQSLKKTDEESKFLIEVISTSVDKPFLYENFIKILTKTANDAAKNGLAVNSSDFAKAALYRKISDEEGICYDITLEDNPTTAILAYHELHTHIYWSRFNIKFHCKNIF